MRRTIRGIRVLALAGMPILAFGLTFLAFDAGAICFDACPDESELAATIAARIVDGVPMAAICAVPVALAWIMCLVQLGRAGRRWALAALALALPLVAILSLAVLSAQTNGTLVPTTWGAFGTGWDRIFLRSLALLLLWPVATFAATFALRGRR